MGSDGEQIDLFAIQPLVSIDDYLDEEVFVSHHRRLAQKVDALRGPAAGRLPALAVWPEYVGTFLMLAGRQREVGGCTKVTQVMRRIVLRESPSVASTMVRYRTRSVSSAVMTMLSPRAHRIYVATFAAIARDFGLWVTAGSALFPRNRLAPGSEELVASSADLYNTSYTFSPTGAVSAIIRKVNLVPTQEDVLGVCPAPVEELAVIDTPLGRLGTLICYDGFREPHTSSEPNWQPCAPVLDRLGATVVAQPSANAWAWDEPWVFNDPGQHLLRREQWFSEGLASLLPEMSSIRYVVNPQLVGTVLDSTFEAPSLILARCGTEVRALARASDPRGEEVLHARVHRR